MASSTWIDNDGTSSSQAAMSNRCIIIGTIHPAPASRPLLQPGAVLERERTLKTALHYCAESGEGGVTSAAVLLEAAPELVHAQDQDGYSALHLAVIAGNLPLTKLLLSHGAPVNMPDHEGHTPSHWATVCGEIECLELLLSKGGDPNIGDMHGGCPLHYAAQMCGPCSDMPADRRLGMAALRILLDKGADANLPDNHGRQPILWAASAGGSEAILALVAAGANVAAADKDGLTALHCAASRGHTDCVESLINLCSSEPDVIDNNGCSSLFYAVTLGHADATQTLLNHGANTNRQDRKGRTAVHCGAAKGQLETLKVVAAWGGNLWQKTVRGDYPLHDAVASGRRPLVLWLLAQRPDAVNCPNNDGRCPLHIAAIQNNVEMCKTLLDSGSLVNPVMRTAKGAMATPLDAALHKGHRGCAKYLQLHGGVPASRLNSESAARRGLSSSRGEAGRSTDSKLAKEEVLDKLQAVDGTNQGLRTEVKPSSAHFLTSEKLATDSDEHQKERCRVGMTSSPRPHILQVYVEDDLMIRRLRPHVGSDSSIEERVRRRRRKRKTKLLAEREKSAPARFHLKDVSSSDEAANSKEQTDARNSREKVEKIVQTEFSLKPSSLPSQFEGMLLETINDGETATDELRQNRQSRETMPPTRDHISSGDSDKNTSIQIVEALVHKERVSLESEEQDRLSEKEERDDEELANQIDGGLNGDTSLTQSKFNEVGSFDDGTPQPTEIAGDQGSAISTSKNESGKTGESGKTLGQQQAQTSENETNAAGLPEPVGEVKKEEPLLINEHAGHPVMVDGDKSATRPEPCTVNDDSSERPDRFEAHHNEMLHVDGIKSSGTLSATSAQETTINEEAGLGGTVQTVGNEVPNDDLVAEVLLKSFQEDNDGVSPHPSGQADESHDEKENKDSLHSRPTIGGISADEDILVAKGSLDQEEGNETQSSTKESLSVKDEFADTTGMKDGDVKDVDYSSEKIQSAEQESGTNIHFAQEADGEEERVLKTDPAVKKSIDKDEEDAYKYSRDSLDMEGSLDELAMNITKDSDDAPIEPTIGLPEPVENVELVKPWDSAVESQADRVAVDVINASADRALIKVLGDPTGGLPDSAVTADKRKHLRRKREGNKRWMNTRSTESFEVLKLPDDRTDEDVLFEDDKTSGIRDGSQSPATKGGKVKRSTSRGKVRMQRPCKRNKDTDLDPAALSTVSVTQAVQYSIRKYHLERRIFYQLLEVKRLQIRAGRASEAVLVKRLVDEHKRAGLMLGLQQYDGVYTFRSFEKFLYEQLRLLQTSERRIIPRLKSTDDLERLTAALRKTRAGQEILASVPNNPALCTHQTHRCHHATHAYTGIPCAAYIARPNHHTMPKPAGAYTGFLPKLVSDESAGEVAKTLRHVDPTRPLTLELSHGVDKQIIQLPTEKLDKSKKYFVTFTIKSGSNNQERKDSKRMQAAVT